MKDKTTTTKVKVTHYFGERNIEYTIEFSEWCEFVLWDREMKTILKSHKVFWEVIERPTGIE